MICMQQLYLDCGLIISDILTYHMQAPLAHNSSIKIHFGDSAHKGAPSPLQLSFTLDFFSEEEKTIRQKIEQSLGIIIPPTGAVFELVVLNGNSKEIAEQLNNTETIKNINQNSPSQLTYYGLQNKLYVVIKTFLQFQQDFSEVKPQASNETHQVRLDISSHNDLARISELLVEKGPFGFLDSLEVNFGFNKTKTTEAIIVKVLEKIGFAGSQNLLKSFKRLNLELNGASSSILNQFPKVVFKPIIKKTKNDVSAILTNAAISEANFYLLSKTLFLKGRFEVNGLAKLIEVLYN